MKGPRAVMLGWLLAVAPLAAASDDIDALKTTYAPLVGQCLDEVLPDTGAAQQCIGAAAQACMAQEEGGQTTLGMSWCMAAETQFWDEILNREYQQTLAAFQALDDEDQAIFPEYANRVAALRTAQRAWLQFYDSECALDYAVWGAGSMRHIAGNSCALDMKAARSLALIDKRRMMQ